MNALTAQECAALANDPRRLGLVLTAAQDISVLAQQLAQFAWASRQNDAPPALIVEVVCARIEVLSDGIAAALDDYPADATEVIESRLYPHRAHTGASA